MVRPQQFNIQHLKFNIPVSRAFVKDDSAGLPPIVPPRPALPPGTPNYVTPRGLALLRAELTDLEAERSHAEADRANDADRTRQLTILNGRLGDLTARLATARVVNLQEQQQPADEVRFGATVLLRTQSGGQPGQERRFTIVGVDEASVAEGRVAFVAPIARAVQGARRGQTVALRLGPREEIVEVVSIAYDDLSA